MSPTGAGTRTRPRPADRPPLDPRLRQRRAAVARQQGRRRLWVLVALVVASGAVVGGWFLLHSSMLSARVVTVIGSTHTPAAEVESVAGLSDHPPLIDVDPGAVAARLEALPWVRSASVRREWPDGVRVEIVEQAPAAVVALPDDGGPAAASDRWALVDRAGRVLADASSQPAGLVELVGSGRPGPPGSWLPAVAGPGLTVAATLPEAFSKQVTAVVVGRDGAVTLRMTTPVTIDLGNTTQLEEKYEDAAAVLAGANLVAGDVIDVSVPEAPTVDGG